MKAEINFNNVIQAISIALLCWCGNTLYKLDKQSDLVQYRIEQIEHQTFYNDCKWCNHNHSEHGKITKKEWQKR